MYSKYSYQAHCGGMATQTPTSTSVQPTNLSWNGTKWVSVTSTVPSSPASNESSKQYQHPQQQSNHTADIPPPQTQLPPIPPDIKYKGDPSLMSLDQLVKQYSAVYHHYAAEVNSFNNDNSNYNPIERQRKREWAVYHCDLSARAAHHYNDLLTKHKNSKSSLRTRVGGMKQMKDLKQKNEEAEGHRVRFTELSSPNKKKNTDTPTTNTTKTKKKTTKKTVAPTSTKDSQSEQPPPESFRRYAHKNLLLCTTDTQRRGMQELLTMTMESSIRKQEFYSKNWDFESLLPVPGGEENRTSNENKVSSESSSLKRKHSFSSQVSDSQMNSRGGNASKEQRNNNNNNNNDITGISRNTSDPTPVKVLKKMNSINEQKKTMDDWYGGSGGESVKDGSSQSGACITFEPKVFKKKRKNGWATNAKRRQSNSRTTMEKTKTYTSYEESPKELVMKQKENDNFSNSLDNNTCHAVPQKISSESVGQFKSHAAEHKQAQSNLEQRQTVSDWYDTPTPEISNHPISTESIKREINMHDQQQTLNDWYGGENSTDSKKNVEAAIVFKPKPLKKKKKNRKYMKKPIFSAKPKISRTQEKKNVDSSDASQNGILILPRVQPGSTGKDDYHSLNGKTKKVGFNDQVDKKGNDYNLQQSPQTYDRDGFRPKEQMSHKNDVKETKTTRGDAMMEEYYSPSLSHRQDKRIKEEHRPQQKMTAERYNESTTQQTHCPSSSSKTGRFSNSGIKKSKHLSNDMDNSKNKLAHRATRFAGPGGISTATSTNLLLEYNRNTDKYMGKSVIGGTHDKILTEEDYEKMTVKGCCQVLEKSYLRLTSPPRAELVRPQEILSRHLQNLKQKWRVYRENLYSPTNLKRSNGDELSYTWFCSQFKALRQDLTVQRIFNAFSVDVYETHAKIALQENDLNEYNQSQTQLKELYFSLSHQASVQENCLTVAGLENQNEFIAYRIIYYVFLTGNQKYDGGSSDLLKIMISLTPAQRKDSAIVHALKVRVAVAEHDYHAFFRLQDVCPNLGAYLMDTLVPKVRAHGLRHMIQTYRPSISVSFVLQELGFSVDETDSEGGKSWLQMCGCKFSNDGSMIITKKSYLNETHLAGVRSSSLI